MTTANVSVGAPKTGGALYIAPTTATLPTAADSTLTGFSELGFASEDGITNNNSTESTEIKAWGGQTVLIVGSEKSDEFGVTLIESLNPVTLKAVYGDSNVTVNDTNHTITLNVNGNAVPEKAFVIDMAMTGGALKRIVIPKGTISELGEITYKDDEAIGYELTIKALPDSNGNTHYEYIKLASPAST